MLKTKIKHYFSLPRLVALLALILLVIISTMQPLASQAVTLGYDTDETLQRGSIVIIKRDDSTKVEAITQATAERMHGVVVNPDDAPVSVSKADQKIFVASSGQFEVLVSDQNGPIAIGDHIAVSGVSGVGMKADSSQKVVIGSALSPFDGSNGVVGTATVNGSSQATNLGRVMAEVGVARNPMAPLEDPGVPGVVRKVSEAIANKEVSSVKIYTSLVLLILTSAITGSMLFGGIRSSITAIGRNPLSKHSVVRSLLQVVISSMAIFISGLFGVYLLLKL